MDKYICENERFIENNERKESEIKACFLDEIK